MASSKIVEINTSDEWVMFNSQHPILKVDDVEKLQALYYLSYKKYIRHINNSKRMWLFNTSVGNLPDGKEYGYSKFRGFVVDVKFKGIPNWDIKMKKDILEVVDVFKKLEEGECEYATCDWIEEYKEKHNLTEGKEEDDIKLYNACIDFVSRENYPVEAICIGCPKIYNPINKKWIQIDNHIWVYYRNLTQIPNKPNTEPINIHIGDTLTFIGQVNKYRTKDKLRNGIHAWYPISSKLQYHYNNRIKNISIPLEKVKKAKVITYLENNRGSMNYGIAPLLEMMAFERFAGDVPKRFQKRTDFEALIYKGQNLLQRCKYSVSKNIITVEDVMEFDKTDPSNRFAIPNNIELDEFMRKVAIMPAHIKGAPEHIFSATINYA